MNHLTQGEEPPVYRPILLPETLQQLHRALAAAPDTAAGQTAALAIVQSYCNNFNRGCIQQDLQYMLSSTLCNANAAAMQDAAARQDMFMFYECTLMLVDAVFALHARKG